jgi:hypothetical protein
MASSEAHPFGMKPRLEAGEASDASHWSRGLASPADNRMARSDVFIAS